jgi:hypothetical protein
MTPHKVEFYLYAEHDSEAKALAEALHTFVERKRKQGIAVTADKVRQAVERFENNFFVCQYLR